MQGLVTDRTQANVLRRNNLAARGWANLTADEQAEWLGSPLARDGVNLLPYGPYYSSAVSLKHTNDAINATATAAGSYLYAVLIVGPAAEFENRIMTLSADYIGVYGGGNPQLALYWHDGNGFEHTGAFLAEAGSATFHIGANAAGREYLAMYIYVTGENAVVAGASARFRGVMLEFGDKRHEYSPYMEILPTDTTKGAYNYSDLNRVERAATELSDLYGLALETKTDWTGWDVPQKSDMVRYITNIKKIRHASFDPNGMATAPDGIVGLNYNDANNIEKILLAAHEKTDYIIRFGELYCGEV